MENGDVLDDELKKDAVRQFFVLRDMIREEVESELNYLKFQDFSVKGRGLELRITIDWDKLKCKADK
jgi:hypothetical protein